MGFTMWRPSWLSVCLLLAILGHLDSGVDARSRRDSTPPSNLYKQVCYPLVGCYDNKPPFDYAMGVLPHPPEELGVQYRLFTRQNIPNHDILVFNDTSTVNASSFDPSKKTALIMHGFNSDIEKRWMAEIKDELLKKEDMNVVKVGWDKGSRAPYYEDASANIRVVATMTKLLIDAMVMTGLDLANVYLIGHSLGSHMAGIIGNLTGSKIGRITGLDPAQPYFENKSTLIRLDPSDAVFVDVMHTDSQPFNPWTGGYGLKQISGHVDIYVNGGNLQPGCPKSVSGLFDHITSATDITEGFGEKVACSHLRAPSLFRDSIKGSCSYQSFPCESYEQFEAGHCLSCTGQGCSSMGYLADTMSGRGPQYINTVSLSPYCGKYYILTVTPSPYQLLNNHGTVYMALEGNLGTGHSEQITPINKQLPTQSPVHHVAVFKDVGPPKAVHVKFVKSSGFFDKTADVYVIKHIQLQDPHTGKSYKACGDDLDLQTGQSLAVSLHEDCPKSPIG